MIDWQEAESHVLQLGITPEDGVLVALFPPKVGRSGGCRYFNLSLHGELDHIDVEQELARRPGYSLGFIPNPGGTKDAEIRFCRALFFEDDSNLPVETKKMQWEAAGLPHPSLQIWTGGKSVHHYWILQEPCTPDLFRAGQKRLAAHAARCLPDSDIDTALYNPARILRLAGGTHPETGETSRILTATGERFVYERLWNLTGENVSPPKPAPPRAKNQPQTLSGFVPQDRLALPDFESVESQTFRKRQDEYDVEHKPSGLHYAKLPHAAKRQVLTDALAYCPERDEPGSNTYPVAFPIFAALVNAMGAEEAVSIAKAAAWSREHWDLEAAASLIEENSASRSEYGHKSIYFLFDTAEYNGWPRPWSLSKTVASHRQQNGEDDELLAELRQHSFQQWSDSRTAHLQLSSIFHPSLAQMLGGRAEAFPVAHTAMLAPFLTTMSSVLGTRYSVQVKVGWKEPMVFWMGTVAPASSLKTPVANQFLKPLSTLDLDDQRVYKEALRRWKSQDKESRQDPPALPRQRVVMDATLEGLCSLLEREGVPGAVSFHDELAAFIGDMDKYRSTNSDRAHWLSMWSGGPINILRKNSEPVMVEKTAVSLFGAIQQDKLSSLLHGDDAAAKSGDGFWARFLWVIPPYVFPAQNLNESDINPDLRRLIHNLDQCPRNTVATLTSEAWDLFAETCDAWSTEADKTYAARGAFLGKLRGYLARFAGLLWAIDEACTTDEGEMWAAKPLIDREVMERAVLLTKFFLCQFDVLAPEVGGGDLPSWVTKVVSFGETSETGRVTHRDLMRKKWAKSSDEARGMLKTLAETYGVGSLKQGRRVDQVWWEL